MSGVMSFSPSPSTGEGRGGGGTFARVPTLAGMPASHPLPNPSPIKGEGLESLARSI